DDPAAVTPELMEPFAIGKQGSVYMMLHEAAGDGDTADIKHSYHVRVLDGAPGVEIKPSGGVRHLLAKNHFDTADEGTAPSKVNPELDWDEVRVTVSAEWDEYCEGFWPEGAIAAVP